MVKKASYNITREKFSMGSHRPTDGLTPSYRWAQGIWLYSFTPVQIYLPLPPVVTWSHEVLFKLLKME